MARPREFDIDEALDRAMNVFWAKGYEGASLQDLLEAMGIARGSLYKAFDDKRSVYLAALGRYDRTVVQAAVDLLSDPDAGDGVDRIRRFLRAARDAVAEHKDRRGCFLCNAAVDQAPVDAAVQTQVRAMMKRLERATQTALRESRPGASWPAKRRAEIALLVTNAYVGLRVLAKSGYAARDLAGIAESTLRTCGLATIART
jgi:TetR/AcrR family transcriptional repressor of nem operon